MRLPNNLGFSPPALETLDPSTLQGVFIVVGIFIALVLVGFSRHYLVSSSLQGVWAGFIMGIIVIFLIEGLLFWGSKNFLYGEKAELIPDNIRLVLTSGQENLNQVLGLATERKKPTAQTVISDYQTLSSLDSQLVQGFVCESQSD